jgi:KDO2-lipid IV(A) lauroyltransferase
MTFLRRAKQHAIDLIAAALACVAYVLVYHLVRYRRQVVADNLSHAMPDLNDAELRRLQKASYRHLGRMGAEILLSPLLSREDFSRRVTFRNLDLLESAARASNQVIVLLLHQGNWEWILSSASASLSVPVDPVYKTLHSPFWNRYMLRIRSRFGASPIALADAGRNVVRARNRQRIIGLVADQSGPRVSGYWTDFLNRPASFYRGAEKLARSMDIPVYFAQCRVCRPGYYEVEFLTVSTPPHAARDDEITRTFVAYAERSIRLQPRSYLWTNRRWKRKPPEPKA